MVARVVRYRLIAPHNDETENAMFTIDQTGDLNGQQLYRLSKLYPLPEFVKKASSQDIFGSDDLETHQYADPAHRLFPCHTAPATYVSTLFFMDKRAELSPEACEQVDARLDQFAFMYGIGERIADLREKIATAIDANIELTDDDYALVLSAGESPSGVKEAYYPLRNALEVKRAAEYLSENRDAIPYEYRHRMATSILKKANVVGAGLGDLDEFLLKQAGEGACLASEVVELLAERAILLRRGARPELAEQIEKMAAAIAKQPAVAQDSEQLVEIANIIDQVDRASGLKARYDDLTCPEDVFFSITSKVASQIRNEHVSTTSGSIYRLDDMDALKVSDVKDVMGDDFAEAISTSGLFISPEKLAEVAPTLPRGDAELFDQLLNSVGITPVAKEAAHVANRLEKEDLIRLASYHQPA